jgi:hypothetical protein
MPSELAGEQKKRKLLICENDWPWEGLGFAAGLASLCGG